MIKAVFIDIDNTLLDFDAYVREAMKNGIKKYGLGSYEDSMYRVFEKINTEMWMEIEQNRLTYDELLKTRWNRIFSALGISFDGYTFEKYFKACLFDSAIPVEGAIDILDYLKNRYILCAASNGPYEQQLNRLKNGKMLSYFSKVFISEKVGFSKPDKRFFDYCIKEINADSKDKLSPCEIIMIGDSISSDLAGAVDSGIKACYFDRQIKGCNSDLHIDYVINKLEDIRLFL